MPTGVCRLCLKTKSLRKSHLMPAAMYKNVVGQTNTRNPVVIARNVSAPSSKQVADYLLCADCEDLFNKNGERWMLSHGWNGESFPLRDRLNVAMPRYELPGSLAFSGRAVGIDTDKLGYFALSILWRAAVRRWNEPFGGQTSQLPLQTEQEDAIRKFLLGEAPFPDFVVMVTVCTDKFSTESFFMPTPVLGPPGTSFSFLTPGIHFRIFVGTTIPQIVRAFCCVNSVPRVIFLRDCSKESIDAFAQILATSKQSKSLTGTKNQRKGL